MKRNRTTEDFINESKQIHGNLYDYSKSIYVKRKEKVIIKCKKHGEFLQTPDSHLLGRGCDKCAHEKLDNKRRKNLSTFIKEAKLVHNNFYTYKNSKYISWNKKLEITCPKHGSFFQVPNNHLRGHGCHKCIGNTSKAELEILKFIRKHTSTVVIQNDRTQIKPKELDIYLPNLNLAFEFNGTYWHSERFKDINHREEKTKLCKNKNINLIHIEEKDWKEDKQKVLKFILNILKINK